MEVDRRLARLPRPRSRIPAMFPRREPDDFDADTYKAIYARPEEASGAAEARFEREEPHLARL